MDINNNEYGVVDQPDFSMGEISVKKMSQLLKLRAIMQSLSNQTFNYSILNKKHPIATLTSEEEADAIIDEYNGIIREIRKLVVDIK